jgi:hypothetical protein
VVRAGAFFAVVPLFGRQTDSFTCASCWHWRSAAVFWWVGDQRVEVPDHLLALGVMATREVIDRPRARLRAVD